MMRSAVSGLRGQRRWQWDKSETGGYYGRGSAPPGWDTNKAGKYDDFIQDVQERKGVNLKIEHGYDMSPRGSDKEHLAGVPVFKMNITKKTQEEIDRENAGMGQGVVADLTDQQRSNMRRRRRRRALWETFLQSVRVNSKFVNKGRSNIGILNFGDNNIGMFNIGDNNTGFLTKGDYNTGALVKGNDNKGFVIYGSGNIGALIFGNQNRGVDIWGDKERGWLKTSQHMMKIRLRVIYLLMACFVMYLPYAYNEMKRRERKRWLKAMDLDVTDENVGIMMSKKRF